MKIEIHASNNTFLCICLYGYMAYSKICYKLNLKIYYALTININFIAKIIEYRYDLNWHLQNL